MAHTDRQMRSTNLIGEKIGISLIKDRKGEDQLQHRTGHWKEF